MTPYSQLRYGPRVDLLADVPLPGPLAIYFEPTDNCNFKCTVCPISLPTYRETVGGVHKVTMDEFKMVAQQIKSLGGLKTLNFYMLGEPFLHKNLCEMISHASEQQVAERLIVTSNGSLITEEKYEAICRSGLHYVRISVYGSSEKTNTENTGQTKVSFGKIRANVAGLKRYRDAHGYQQPYIYVKTIERSPEENAAFLSFFDGAADELYVEHMLNWTDQVDLKGVDKAAIAKGGYLAKRKKTCPFLFYTLTINSDLNVTVCDADWAKVMKLGNLRTETLSQIWRGQKLREYQLLHLRGERGKIASCANCTFANTSPDDLDSLTADQYLKRL